MTQNQVYGYGYQLLRSLFISGIISFVLPVGAIAQRIPIADDTLGDERSVVTPFNPVIDQIDGGARRGANLFHSFREFNIEAGRGAYFTNPDGVANILARVTGGTRSDILGTLGVDGSANLFLLNPNGILFGPNAQLDIRGSFLASTANSFLFNDGFAFSATDLQAPPLLTVNVPTGLQYGSNPGVIRVEGASLQVLDGQTLTLAGGTVNISGGQLFAPGGRVEIAGVAALGEVGLIQRRQMWRLGVPEGLSRADVAIRDSAVSVSSVEIGNSGNINILGRSTFLTNTSLTASNTEQGNAGRISINASNNVSISDGTLISSNIGSRLGVETIGNVGEIEIEGESVFLNNRSQLLAGFYAGGQGEGGLISIRATDSVEIDNAALFADSEAGAVGNSSDIEISGRSISFNSSLLTSRNAGEGDAGNVIINAPQGTVTIDESVVATPVEGRGNGGNIEITTGSLVVRNVGGLLSFTLGQGDAGDITIHAPGGSVLFENKGGAVSTVESGASGNGGNIEITTGSLIVRGGSLYARNTGGQGNAGSIRLIAEDTIIISGNTVETENGETSTITVASDVDGDGIGNGNDITMTARSIHVTDDALISASVVNQSDNNGTVAQAGNINISATERVSINNNSVVFSEVNSFANGGTITISAPIISIAGASVNTQIREGSRGQAGNINVFAAELLEVTGGGQLATATSGQGNAGNINISGGGTVIFEGTGNNRWALNAPNYAFTDAIPDISGAFSAVAIGAIGQGGDIRITADSLSLSDGAQVNAATSGQGRAGNIIFNTPTFTVAGDAQVLAETSSPGDGGSIVVNAPTSVNLRRTNGASPVLSVQTRGAGEAGDITINTPSLTLAEQARITATATATATNPQGGGSVTINASNLNLAGTVGVFAETQSQSPAGTLTLRPDNNRPNLNITLSGGARISASTSSSGRGGDLFVTAPEAIAIRGNGRLSVETAGRGIAGNIEITAPRLTIADGATVSASTASTGQGGNLSVNVPVSVQLSNRGQLLTESTGSGRSGNLTINTPRLTLQQGSAISASNQLSAGGDVQLQDLNLLSLDRSSITASTQAGQGGSLQITTREGGRITLNNRSRLAAEATNGGNAGSLTINNADILNVATGSSVTVSSPEGRAGNLRINAASVTLDNGTLEAIAGAGSGGNITLNASGRLLQLSNRSQISAQARNNASGGNVTLEVPNGFIVANPFENSDILANAEGQGNGGNINITTQTIFGLAERNPLSPFSDINASSQFGLDGAIALNTLTIDPSQGLAALPENVAPPDQINQQCDADSAGDEQGSFVITGRGGLPPNVSESLNRDAIQVDLVTANIEDETLNSQQELNQNTSPTESPIVEAQGWQVAPTGEVRLVAAVPQQAVAMPLLRSAPSSHRIDHCH